MRWLGPEFVLGAALYAAVFASFSRVAGDDAVALALGPVTAAGWLLGRRTGLLAGILVVATTLLLFWLLGEPSLLLRTLRQWPMVLAAMGAGLAAGWLGILFDGPRKPVAASAPPGLPRAAGALQATRLEAANRTAAEPNTITREQRPAATAFKPRPGFFFEQVVAAQEEERRRVARELHDGVSQLLAAMVFRLRLLEDAASPEEGREHLAQIKQLCTSVTSELQRLTRGLHPVVLDDLGLVPAVQRYAADFQKNFPIRVDFFFLALAPGRMPRAVELTLYRAIQEALANAAKHATATTVSIVVEFREGLVRAIVEDDGKGTDSQTFSSGNAAPGHLGMFSIRERTALLNGVVNVESRGGAGTTISIAIPLEEAGA